jgi:hypothetical protein
VVDMGLEGDALGAGREVQGQILGLVTPPQLREASRQPVAKQVEEADTGG